MQRKNSLKGQSINSSLDRAKKIYRSNKSISHKQIENNMKRNKISSINDLKVKKLISQPTLRPKACSQLAKQDKRKQKGVQKQKYMNMPKPLIKTKSNDYQCESTAEDLLEKINKKIPICTPQSSNIMKELLDFKALKYRKRKIVKEGQFETITTQKIPPLAAPSQKKVFQCKIIKSIKIPFPIINKSSQRRRKFQCLVSDTDQISQIQILPNDPESQFMIEF